MGSQLFKDFVKKAILDKQPGPPPREGLRWKPQTHRWIRPKEQVSPEQDWSTAGENTFTFNDFKENHMNDKTIQDIDNFVAEMLKQEVEDPEVGPWGIVGMHDFLGQVVEELDIVTPNMDDDTHLDKAMEWIDEQVQNAVNKHGHKEPEFKSKFDFGRVNPSSPEYQERHERMPSGYVRQKPSVTGEDEEDFYSDFDINEHKDGIKNYLDEVWTDYNHLSPNKIHDAILMPLIEDLDIVLPQDDEGMDNARESLEGYLGEAIQRKKLSSMGKSGRQLGRMGESKRRKR